MEGGQCGLIGDLQLSGTFSPVGVVLSERIWLLVAGDDLKTTMFTQSGSFAGGGVGRYRERRES